MKMWDLIREQVSPSRLYHWTGFGALPEILKSNTLKASASQFSNDAGVSFARVPTATSISGIRPAVLVFDQEKVAHNHRMIPRYGDSQQAADFVAGSGGEYEAVVAGKETEEKVMGDVKPIDRMLTHIVCQWHWYNLMVDGYVELHTAKYNKRRANLSHPEAAYIMEWVANHPVGILPTDNLTAAWTRKLDTDSVYPSTWSVAEWKERARVARDYNR